MITNVSKTREIILTSRPVGMPSEANFSLKEETIKEPLEGEVLIKTLYLSVDPYMRGRMREGASYITPFHLNQPLKGGGVGCVEKSKSPLLKEGDIVAGLFPWADYVTVPEDGLRKIDPQQAPISTALGILGMPGLTAYFGLLDIGRPKQGETVVVSGAAGAVGSVAAQIAKIKGCRVVGIAGGNQKVHYLKEELHLDAVIDYKAEDMGFALKESCPNGIDVYFDNVGGATTDHVLNHINKYARIVLCGQISTYNADKPELGPRNLLTLVTHSALMQGFIVSDYTARFTESLIQLEEWLKEGKLHYKETIVDGLENLPKAFIGLFKGENLGKQLVKVD